MPARQSYFPKSEAGQVLWLQNFKVKLPVHSVALDLDAAEVTETVVDVTFVLWVLEVFHSAVRNDAKEATAYKKFIMNVTNGLTTPPPAGTVFTPPPTAAPGVFKRIFNLVVRIKASAGYSEAIGLDLQVIGPEDTAEHASPDFTVTVEEGAGVQKVVIKFTKFGHQGVVIDWRRGNFAGPWLQLTIGTDSPYIDEQPLQNPPMPEAREYRLRFWDRGQPNGEWSAVKQVTVR